MKTQRYPYKSSTSGTEQKQKPAIANNKTYDTGSEAVDTINMMTATTAMNTMNMMNVMGENYQRCF